MVYNYLFYLCVFLPLFYCETPTSFTKRGIWEDIKLWFAIFLLRWNHDLLYFNYDFRHNHPFISGLY